MEQGGLIFIPDISGFTRFVNETEIEHSRLVIQELLEALINANQIGLEISEIEGDAILFYKFGGSPDLKELYDQVEKMFRAFHRCLNAYEARRFCQCTACKSAASLTLKIISHYGEFTSYQVRDFKKLIGKDIIIAHQLLKNDIDQHEYWLVTKNLIQDYPPADFTQWMKWTSSSKRTDSGEISFHYTQLSELKNELPPDLPLQLELSPKVKVMSLSKEYDTDIITLFHATGDFHYRSNWQDGVKKVEEVDHMLPRVGMRCRRIMENGQANIYASSYRFSPEKIEFSETDERKENALYFTLEKKEENRTKLTLDFYIKKSLASQIAFKLSRQKAMKSSFEKSLLNLEKFIQATP